MESFIHEATATQSDGLVDVWVIVDRKRYKYTLRNSFTYRYFLRMVSCRAYGRALNVLKQNNAEVK